MHNDDFLRKVTVHEYFAKTHPTVEQWFSTFFDAFLPLLILELFILPSAYANFIPPLFGFVD